MGVGCTYGCIEKEARRNEEAKKQRLTSKGHSYKPQAFRNPKLSDQPPPMSTSLVLEGKGRVDRVLVAPAFASLNNTHVAAAEPPLPSESQPPQAATYPCDLRSSYR
jgi:hypothetical protein